MSIQVKGNEKITQLLNNWYIEIRSQHMIKAQQLKQKLMV